MSIAEEILEQWLVWTQVGRTPARINVSWERMRDMYDCQWFVTMRNPDDPDAFGYIWGMPVYPVHPTGIVRVVPDDWQGEGQGASR